MPYRSLKVYSSKFKMSNVGEDICCLQLQTLVANLHWSNVLGGVKFRHVNQCHQVQVLILRSKTTDFWVTLPSCYKSAPTELILFTGTTKLSRCHRVTLRWSHGCYFTLISRILSALSMVTIPKMYACRWHYCNRLSKCQAANGGKSRDRLLTVSWNRPSTIT